MKKRCIENAPPSLLINHISKAFNDRMRQKTEAMGMSEGMRKILFHLKHNDKITQQELAKRCQLSKPAVTVILQKMEADGLVLRKHDPADRRTILLSLTEAGNTMDRKVIRTIQETEQELLEGITPEELEALRPILLKMYKNISKEGKE